MAATVLLLDLRQTVSVPDLQHFLSHLPEGFDSDQDLRTSIDEGGEVHFFEIHLPAPEV